MQFDEVQTNIMQNVILENREKLIDEIDKENLKNQEKNEKTILNEAKDKLFEQIKYSKL